MNFPTVTVGISTMRCRINGVAESVQYMGPQFMIHGLPTIDTLDEKFGIWSPATIITRTPNITHGSSSENYVGQGIEVGYAVGDYREENNKIYFEIWNKNSKLQSKPKNIEMS